jgi:Xaa-Pro aminopeptidase
VAGMVITVEPGIYINPEMLKFIYDIYGSTVPKTELDDFVKRVAPAFSKYANIGIRIEDDILITNSGNENLSQAIPKQPEAIERLMNKK